MKEIKYLRKLKEKYFMNSDGTISSYVYKNNVHYICENKLRTINNTLIEKDQCYENKYNDFKVKFNNKKAIIHISNNNYYLTISYKNINKFNLVKNDEELVYKDIFNNMDINYKVVSNMLKESIVLYKKPEIEKLELNIKTNLDLELINNRIILKNDNKVIFTFLPMNIDNNIYLDYKLKRLKKSYKVIILFDKEVFNNLEYPLIIDPTIINGREENVFDTYINSENVNTNYGNKVKLKVGTDNSIYRSLIKYNLPEIGTGYQITKATAFITSNNNMCDKRINVHSLNEGFDENVVTWESINNNYDEKIESSFYVDRMNVLNEVSFDLTSLVKEWYSGKENNGILLKLNDETLNNGVYDFASKEYNYTTTSFMRPYLIITYKIFNGLVDYIDYTNINHTNGLMHVNNLNGNLVGEFYLNKTINGVYPITLKTYYNTSDVLREKNNFANGFKLNLYEELELTTIDTEEYIKYYDGTGSIYYFLKEEDIYKDEDNLNLEIKLVDNQYIMKDLYNNRKVFSLINNKYLLTKLVNKEGKEVSVEYSNNLISKIIDGNLEEINLTYTDNLITISSGYEVSYINLLNNKVSSILTKEGITTFNYDENNLISKITDDNMLSKSYEYYNTKPYKIKKISEYSVNNNIGNYLIFKYAKSSTSIIDKDNKKTVYLFNNNCNTISINVYDKTNMLSNAYQVEHGYLDGVIDTYKHYKNKVLSKSTPVKYIDNLLLNSSFEEDISKCNFICLNSNIVNNNPVSGNNSLFVNDGSISFEVSNSGYYTVSLFVKKNNFLSIDLYKKTLEKEVLLKRQIVNNSEYVKISFSEYFNTSDVILLKINGSCYIDDISLEKGMVSNERNYVENGNFANGTYSWVIPVNSSIVNINDEEKALKVINNPDIETSISKDLHLHGKIGESYMLSFWYKNEGVTNKQDAFENQGTLAIFNLFHVNGDMGDDNCYVYLDTNNQEWQLFRYVFTSTYDFESANLSILLSHEANNFYITNVMVTKNPRVSGYDYDLNGNLITYKGLDNEVTSLKYDKNNELISIFNPIGSNFKYEYDNNYKDRIRKGVSPTGISNQIKYDDSGNPIKTIINNVSDNVVSNKLYYIRSKGTDKYLMACMNFDTSSCNKEKFKLVKSGEYYKIKLNNLSLTNCSGVLKLVNDESDESLFILTKNDNASYIISLKSDFSKCLVNNNDKLEIGNKIVDNYDNEFYLENDDNKLYIENNSTYTSDGKFLTSVTDSLERKTNYEVNTSNGLVTKVVDALGNVTNYTYNDKNQVTSILNNDNLVTYNYNGNNLLNKITCDNKEYNFTYDEFLREKVISINNNPLISYEYLSNNGNVSKKLYGNSSVINLMYDNLDRLNKLVRDDKTYDYLYDNSGNIYSITSNNELYKFSYDLSKRISKYLFNDFNIEYTYNKNNLISDKVYTLNDTNHLEYSYDLNDSIVKVKYGDILFNYVYDYLGRLKTSNVNDSLNVKYEYVTNGVKTSVVLDSLKIGNDIYKYTYDKLYNISSISLNGKVINEYLYDKYNELINEKDYVSEKEYTYLYDNNGNILIKREYDLDNHLINTFNYSYENNNWLDLLTKYNDEVITYDSIGNPLTIGNDVLSWVNGRSLKSYYKDNKLIEYNYNVDGIRISKKVGNVLTKYYVENNQIIFEKTNDNVLYYIRNISGELLGFKYNNELYYYKKNYQGDIIGIYNSNYELIVKYRYDSWGNIISIKDNFNNDITDVNNIGLINPYRYRSYYFDRETNLYYLNSRYYNPKWGRFINADGLIGLKKERFAYNLYSYCSNNPVIAYDSDGYAFAETALVGVASTNPIGTAAALIIVCGLYAYSRHSGTISIDFSLDISSPFNNKNNKKDDDTKEHAVYCLTRDVRKDTCEYVGRTKNLSQTKIRHQNNPYRHDLKLRILDENLTYKEARGEEEYFIRKYNTLNKGNFVNNQIHGISDRNIKYDIYMDATCAHLASIGTTCNYVGGGKWAD